MDLSKFFRCSAQLVEQIGEERFQALLNPENTGKVKDFCDELIEASLPKEMTVGGITYEILSFRRGDERTVSGSVMVERAKEMNANLGEENGQNLLKNWRDIPVALRNKICFVFPGWRSPVSCEIVAYVDWGAASWVRNWDRIGSDWDVYYTRLLRRKAA